MSSEIENANKILATIKTDKEVELFICQHVRQRKYNYFYEYLNAVVMKNALNISEVMDRSGINKNYGYNITNGTRKYPGRDKVIALCMGAGMTYFETQKALAIAKMGMLYFQDERDVRIVAAINNGIRDVLKVNIILEEHGLPSLDI